jgi:tetratricopeptide (TPR) repeat protein
MEKTTLQWQQTSTIWGSAWHDLGNPQKAVDYYEKALSIIITVYGENHPNTATMIGNLGMAWLSLKNLKKALECIQKSYTIFQKIYGDTHPDTRAAKKMLEALKNV